MKVLLDECIDRRFAKALSGHYIRTVPQMGWAGVQNGRLLALAEKSFDIFVTVDRNLSSQQHLSSYAIGVIVLKARTNQLDDLLPLVPKLLRTIRKLKRKQRIMVE